MKLFLFYFISEYKYGVAAPPDISGWNIVTSSEISNDGKTHKSNTLATTGLEQEIPGGKSSFTGKNEEMTMHSHDGDDKNFTSTSGHTSNTILNEQLVTADENSQRFESRTNMSTSSSSFKTSRHQQEQHYEPRQEQLLSKDNISIDDHKEVLKEFNDMINLAQQSLHTGGRDDSVKQLSSQRNTKNNERYPYDSSNKEHFSTSTNTSSSSYTSTNQTDNKINRQIDDNMSTGEKLISRSIDCPDAYTKVITETKSLPDGSIVTTKRYETKGESTSSKQQMSSSSSRVISSSHGLDEHNERIESIDQSSQIRNDADTLKEQQRKEIVLNKNVQDEDIRRHEELRRAELANYATSSKTESHSKKFIQNEKKCLNDEEMTKKYATDIERLTSHTTKDQSSQFNQIDTDEIDRSSITHKTVKKDLSQQFKNEQSPIREHTHVINIDKSEQLISENLQTDQSFRDNSSQMNKVQTIKVNTDTTDNKTNVKKTGDTIEKNTTQTDCGSVNKIQLDAKEQQKITTAKLVTQSDETDRESIASELTEQNFEHIDYRSKRITVDHQPTHDTFARSLRCVSPLNERNKTPSHRSSATSVRSNSKWSSNDRSRRSPSRDTEYSELSQISSNTVTKSTSIQKNSPRPVIGSPDRSTGRGTSPTKNQSPTRVEKSQKLINAADTPLESDLKDTSLLEKRTTPDGALFCGTDSTLEKSQKIIVAVDISLDKRPRHTSPAKSSENAKSTHNRTESRSEIMPTSDGTRNKSLPKSPISSPNRSPVRSDQSKKSTSRNISPAKSPERPKAHKLPNTERSVNISPDRKTRNSVSPDKTEKLSNPVSPANAIKNRSPDRATKTPIKTQSPNRFEESKSPKRPETDSFVRPEKSPERRSTNFKEEHNKTTVSQKNEIEVDIMTLPRAFSPEKTLTNTEAKKSNAEFVTQKTIHIESPRKPSYAKPTESFARHTMPSIHVKSSATQKTDTHTQLKVDRKVTENEIDIDGDESIRSNSPTSTVSDIEYVNMANREETIKEWQSEDVHDGVTYSVPSHPEQVEKQPQETEPFYLIDKDQDDIEPIQQKNKPKIPYTRSETYEERCRAMLGMSTESITTKSTEKRQIVDDQPEMKKTPVDEDTVDFVKTIESGTKRVEPKEKPSVEIPDDKIYEILETVNRTFSKKQENEVKAKPLQSVEDQIFVDQQKAINQKQNKTSTLYKDRIPVVEDFITKKSAYVCGKKSIDEKKVVTVVKPSQYSPTARPSELSPERRRSAPVDEEISRRSIGEIKVEISENEEDNRSPSRSPGRKPISAEVHPNKRPSYSESPERKSQAPLKDQSTKADSRPTTKSTEKKKIIESDASSRFAKTREVFKSKISTESSPDRRQPVKQFPDTPRPSKDIQDQRKKPISTTLSTLKSTQTTGVSKSRENSFSNRTKETNTTNVSSVKIKSVNSTSDTKDIRKTLGTVR